MDFMDQYGIQLFGDSSDDDETYLVSNPRKIKATLMNWRAFKSLKLGKKNYGLYAGHLSSEVASIS